MLMGWFFLRHLNGLYRTFKGDLLLPIILGEVAHHNICSLFSSGKLTTKGRTADWKAPSTWTAMEPCNAFSLSNATGIPRETCRRKLQLLVKQGLLSHTPRGYVIRKGVRERFKESNRRNYLELTALFEELQRITQAHEP